MANHEQIMINEPASNLATKYLDTYGVTVGSTLLLREYTVIGGSTPTALADVITTDPTSNAPGVVVRDVNSSAVVSRLGSTLFVQLDPGHTLGAITTLGSITNTVGVYLDASKSTFLVKLDPSSVVQISNVPTVTANVGTGTMAVYFDQSNPSVKANAGTGSFNVQFDPGHTLGKVDAGLGTFNVQLDPGHTIGNIATLGSVTNTVNVQLDPGHTLGSISSLGSITNTVAVFFSPANPSVSATFSAASIEVIPTTGSRKITDDAAAAMRVLVVGSQTNASLTINGTLTGITNSVAVHVLSTNGTMAVNVGKVDGTVTVRLDPGNTLGTVNQGVASATQAWLTNTGSTAGIFTVSGSTSGVSVSGVNLVAPSASYNFKVFAYSIQTTGIVSVTPKFVNGSGASQTEFWRPLATANQTASTPIGANMAVAPPGFIFATGTNTSLNLLLDTGTLVHYSVSYIKESA